MPKPSRKVRVLKPRKEKVAAPARKPRADTGNKCDAIVLYLRANPQSRAERIADEVGINISTLKYYLKNLRESGQIKVEGKTSAARWSLSDSSNKITPKSQPESEEEDPKTYECFCGHVSSSKERLEKHKLLIHGRTA